MKVIYNIDTDKPVTITISQSDMQELIHYSYRKASKEKNVDNQNHRIFRVMDEIASYHKVKGQLPLTSLLSIIENHTILRDKPAGINAIGSYITAKLKRMRAKQEVKA